MAAGDVAWFFQQLSLLTQAGLPLPECLAQLASGVQSRPLRRALKGLADGTQAGGSLGQLMDQYPKIFTPLHRQLVTVGEQTGTLPEALGQVARVALNEQQTIRRLREILLYPAISMTLGAWIILFLLTGPVPDLAKLNGMNILMNSTEWRDRLGIHLMELGTFVTATRPFWAGALAVISAAVLVLSVPTVATDRWLVRTLGRLPGFRRLTWSWDWSRVFGLLGVLLGRGLPLEQTLRQATAFCASERVRHRLEDLASRCAKGMPLAAAWQVTPGMDPLVAVTLAQTPEAQLPQALQDWATRAADDAEDHRMTLLGVMNVLGFVALTLVVLSCMMMLLLSFSHATGLMENPP
jgi:general secretion pathway protein F